MIPNTSQQKSKRCYQPFDAPVYRADITGGSLKIAESRIVADLLLRNFDDAAWKDAIYVRNVLKARRPATASRLANLVRSRLRTMGPELWKLVRDGNAVVSAHACLAASIKHSNLLGDFLRLVVGEKLRTFSKTITNRDWDLFLDGCRERDPRMPAWSDGTKKRLRSSVFQILAQAGYLENTRTLRLQAVHISDEVIRYLMSQRESYVLRCIQVTR